jgi:hypothetical protein
MSISWKQNVWRSLLGVSVLVLALVLAACESSGKNKSFASQGLTPSVAPVFQTYTGPGFSIIYPESWVIRTSEFAVTFSDLSGAYNLEVSFTPNPQGAATPGQLVTQSITTTRARLAKPQTVPMPSTVTLASVTWSQQAVSGATLSNGQQVEIEVVTLATDYPAHAANTKGVVLTYLGAKALFERAQNTYFAPMLQSFKFIV